MGHEWQAVVADRTRNFGGCPLCRRKHKSDMIIEKVAKRRNVSEEIRQKLRMGMHDVQKKRWPAKASVENHQ